MMEYQGTTKVDFSAAGGHVESVPVSVTISNADTSACASLALPANTWATLVDGDPAKFQFLNGQTLRIELPQGSRIDVEVAMGKGLWFAEGGQPCLEVILQNTTLVASELAKEGHYWQFRLTNYRVTYGDRMTTRLILPGQSGGHTLNRIDFELAGRPWTLIDDLQGQQGHQKDLGANRSLLSGTLSTPVVSGESRESVGVIADDISRLLSFALCTWVNWARCTLISRSGQVLLQHERGVAAAPYDSAHARIDQGPPQGGGIIKGYLEQTYPQFIAKRKLIDHAIGVYVQSQVSNDLLTRTALLNMLLDALEDELVPDEPQIEKGLEAMVDDKVFFAEFHGILAKLTPKWTEARSKQLLGEIKRYNKKPGFGAAVRKAFESLGITGFEQLKLGARHRILHEALVDLSDDKKLPYLLELDYLAFLMIARLLGYAGQFYHPHLGADANRVEHVVVTVFGA